MKHVKSMWFKHSNDHHCDADTVVLVHAHQADSTAVMRTPFTTFIKGKHTECACELITAYAGCGVYSTYISKHYCSMALTTYYHTISLLQV
jgi:hypothetical protein